MSSELFERASRLKLRFQTSRGEVSVEELWDLPLQSSRNPPQPNLDDIAKAVDHELRSASAEPVSFVDPVATAATAHTSRLQLQMDILKHVIGVRQAENKAKLDLENKAKERQRILALIADKKDEQLAGKSLEELEAMVKA